VQQLAGLQEPLAAVAQRLLAVRGGDPVRLRGVFLTSALQDAEPAIDAVLENLAKKTHGSFTPPAPDAAPSRRIFAEELLGTHVLRAGGLARRTTRAQQRQLIRRGVVGGVLGLSAIYVALDVAGAAERNRDLTQQTADASAAVAAELGGRRRTPVESGKLVPVRELLARWEDERGDDADDVREWGLFRPEVVSPLQQFYKKAMLAGVVAPLRDKAEAELRDFSARFESPDLIPDIDDRVKNRLALRFYLLVTRDKKAYELQPISAEAKFLRESLRQRWSGGGRTEIGTAEYFAIERAVDKFIALAQDSDFDLPRDTGLIEQAQEILKREDSVRAEVEKIVDDVGGKEGLQKVNLRTLTGLPDLENDGTEVRPAFTIEGWAYVKASLSEALEADSWVLGLDRTQAVARQRRRGAEMRTVYFNMYIEEWRRFITRTRIAPPSSLDEGKRLMGELVKGPRLPLVRVFAELKRHTELADDYDYGDNKSLLDLLKQNKDKSAQGLVKADAVRREFARLVAFAVAAEGKEGSAGLDQYHGRLKELRDAIGKALENKDEEKALVEQLERAIDFTVSLVQDAELDTWTAGTRKLLVTPLEELRRMLVRDRGTGAVADWCARIVDPMYERFSGRYPFAVDSRSDVAVADFEEFFHPENGVIRKAREELLSGYVVLNGNTVELRDRGRSDGPRLDPGVVRFLNRAQDIGTVMFVNEELRVDFELILACNPQVSKVEFEVEGKKVEFACGNERPTRLRWPGKDEHGASLTAYGRQGRKVLGSSGEWGLFELLERPPAVVPDFKGEEVILFRFDMAAFNLGQLDVRLRPTRVRGGTAFFGLPTGSKQFLALVRAPDVLPPKRLFTNMGACGG
jgi:type VI secretion system protein ImpL